MLNSFLVKAYSPFSVPLISSLTNPIHTNANGMQERQKTIEVFAQQRASLQGQARKRDHSTLVLPIQRPSPDKVNTLKLGTLLRTTSTNDLA